MAAVSSELPLDGVLELAGPSITARCTSVCKTWRAPAEKSHVWRVHVEITCGRVVATALDELQREGRTSLTFKELFVKRWRSAYTAAASAYTWTQVVPPGVGYAGHQRNVELAERFRFLLLEASLIHRQTGARIAFVTLPLDETHMRRMFTKSGVPTRTSGVPFPSFPFSEVESINDCSIVLTLYDLPEAQVAKIMTAPFVEAASSEMADDGVRRFVSHDIETRMGTMPWPEGMTTVSTLMVVEDMMRLLPAGFPAEQAAEDAIDALIESSMINPTIHDATLRLLPVLVVAEDPPSICLRFQFELWEDEGEGVVQEFNTGQVWRLLDGLLVEQTVWV